MKTETYLTEEQANWRATKLILAFAFFAASGAIPAWHFSAEHERLLNYESHMTDKSKQLASNIVPDLSKPEQSEAFVKAVRGAK